MSVIGIIIIGAAVAALLFGVTAWHWPNADPASPSVSATTLDIEVRAHPRLRRLLRAPMDPGTAAGVGLTAALLIVGAVAVVFGVLLAMVHTNTGLARYDSSAARWAASHATSGSTRILRDINWFGSTELTVSLAVVVAAIEYRRSRSVAVIWFLLVVILGQMLLVFVTRGIVDRTRPNIDRLSGFAGTSFPSGHAAIASSTFAAIALLVGRRRRKYTKAILAATAGAIAIAVAETRVLLGVHWVTDVIAGLAIGWGWFALTSIAFGGRHLKFGQPVRIAEQLLPPSPERRSEYGGRRAVGQSVRPSNRMMSSSTSSAVCSRVWPNRNAFSRSRSNAWSGGHPRCSQTNTIAWVTRSLWGPCVGRSGISLSTVYGYGQSARTHR